MAKNRKLFSLKNSFIGIWQGPQYASKYPVVHMSAVLELCVPLSESYKNEIYDMVSEHFPIPRVNLPDTCQPLPLLKIIY